MEYEVRYYFPTEKLEYLLRMLRRIDGLKMEERSYEKTMQFDHPCKEMSFYNKEIDGRFRIRITKNNTISKCKISWKRRLPTTIENEINKEEEVEININYNEYDNLMFIINNVLKMKSVESYERYRTIFVNDEIEIAVDEYPFGIALEIENKSKSSNPEEVVKKWVEIIGLDINKAYRLSWDDKYSSLCKSQNVKRYNHVTFGLPMPKVIE